MPCIAVDSKDFHRKMKMVFHQHKGECFIDLVFFQTPSGTSHTEGFETVLTRRGLSDPEVFKTNPEVFKISIPSCNKRIKLQLLPTFGAISQQAWVFPCLSRQFQSRGLLMP